MKVIAITGKGGTGKTVMTAMFIRSLVNRDKTILAIDADPDTNLPEALGDEVEETVGDQREFLMEERDNLPPDTDKERLLESKIYSVLAERHGYDLLVMGRPEGAGCYCFANNMLRGIMDRIVKNYDLTIIDTAAGLEHLSRGIIRDVDELVVVTDGSRRGLMTAERIRDLVKELNLKIRKMHVILNKVTPQNRERLNEYAQELGLEVAGMVPFDEEIARFDLDGRPLIELPDTSPAVIEMENIIIKLGI
ncbi:MAG: CO dehydrogenase maturation factor [Candidatus Methanocomedens sp.]|nr:MAG: CO dehydrogenase maturation factor [ANME-2 cluster archaeon]